MIYPILLLASVSAVGLAGCSQGKPVAHDATVARAEPPVASTSWQQPPAAAASTPISDDQAAIYARLSRVESDVASLKGDIATIVPALEKLPALQQKLHELVEELQRIDDRIAENKTDLGSDEVMAPAASLPSAHAAVKEEPKASNPSVPEPAIKPAPAKGLVMEPATPAAKPVDPPKVIPMKPAAKAEAPALVPTQAKKIEPAAGSPAPKVSEIRFGEHPDKTRLVLDLTGKTTYSYDLDNDEKILIVDLPKTGWNAPEYGSSFAKSSTISAWSVQGDEKEGRRLVIQLKQPVKVIASQALLPNGERGDRILIDIAPAS